MNDDDEDLSWFQEREIDVMMTKDKQGHLKSLAIGNAEKDKWINLNTWAKDVVQKHMK